MESLTATPSLRIRFFADAAAALADGGGTASSAVVTVVVCVVVAAPLVVVTVVVVVGMILRGLAGRREPESGAEQTELFSESARGAGARTVARSCRFLTGADKQTALQLGPILVPCTVGPRALVR